MYGRNYPVRMGSFGHYASEIARLYVVALAAAEVEIYGRMARRPPRLRLSGWEDVERDVSAARRMSSYFWFLGDGPTMLDRIDTVPRPARPARPSASQRGRDDDRPRLSLAV